MTNQIETKPTIGQDLARSLAEAQMQTWLGIGTPESLQAVADVLANAMKELGAEQVSKKPVQTT